MSSDWSSSEENNFDAMMNVELVGAGRIKSQKFEIDYEEDEWFMQGSAWRIERGLAKAVTRRTGIPTKYLTIEHFEIEEYDSDGEHEGEWVSVSEMPFQENPIRALIDPEYVAQIENSYKVLEEDLYKMKNDTDTTDFVLKTSSGTKVFPVHKAILSNRSNVFRAMFTSNMAEDASGEAIIEDLDEETLEELIHFLYTGDLSGSQYDILSLCNAANKYELASLMNLVRLNLMTTELDVGQLADLFIASEMFSQEGLFEVAREKLAEGEGGIEAKDVLEKIKDRPELTNKILELELF